MRVMAAFTLRMSPVVATVRMPSSVWSSTARNRASRSAICWCKVSAKAAERWWRLAHCRSNHHKSTEPAAPLTSSTVAEG